MKKISVIIPNYNCSKYIGNCIDSVIQQSLKDIEIIVIDDGSVDESVKIIKDFIKKDNRIILLEQPNMNAAVARNAGIKIATGAYLYFLDSDDYLYDKYILEKMYNDINGFDLLVGNYVEIDSENQILKKHTLNNEIIYNNDDIIKFFKISPPPSNKLYDASIIHKNKVFFSNIRIAQDLNFYLKYLINCKKITNVDYNIYCYRVLDGSMTRGKNFNFFDIINCFNEVEKYYNNYIMEPKYYKYFYNLELRHYCQQMSRIFYINDKKKRKLVYYYINYAINKIDYKNIIKDEEYKKNCLKILCLNIFHNIILSNTFIKCYSKIKKIK